MTQPSHQNELEQLINSSRSLNDCKLSPDIQEWIETIANNAFKQKGVFTVLVTLLFYKIQYPHQDIRMHKTELSNGFSGRTFDTKYVTPVLQRIGFPAMRESGWLTRSLEQPFPYYLNYQGKISGTGVKESFLQLLNQIENAGQNPIEILKYLFYQMHQKITQSVVEFEPLKNAEQLTVTIVINALTAQFDYKYGVSGAAKLPVIAFYAIYQILIVELKRYQGCNLTILGSLTASDRTSKTSGDIEIMDSQGCLAEALEIKLGHAISEEIVRSACEKIKKFHPKRYYILSTFDIKNSDLAVVNEMVFELKKQHGCQLILNGVIPSLKYYLRLISDLGDFLEIYSKLIQTDSELKHEHKLYWANLIKSFNQKNISMHEE